MERGSFLKLSFHYDVKRRAANSENLCRQTSFEIQCKLTVEPTKVTFTKHFSCECSTNMANIRLWLRVWVHNRELKQPRRRRKRERHLKMSLRVSAIIFQLFKLIMFEKCVLTILELNWNQRLGHKKTKLNICHHMLTSSTQLQNRSFHVVERTRTSSKCQKMKNARAKRAKILFFIVKYANLSGFCCRRRRGCLSSLISSLEHSTDLETVASLHSKAPVVDYLQWI